MKHTIIVLVCCAFLLAIACAPSESEVPQGQMVEEVKDEVTTVRVNPTERGVARAKRDISNGKAIILYYGKPWSIDKPLVDDKSGLPVELLEGCVVTEDFVAEVDAYNRTMREWKNRKAGQ